MVGGFVDLEQAHILAADDRNDDALGARHADAVEQRVGDGLLRSVKRAVLTLAFAGAHHRLAHLTHDRAHVGKVEVDEAGHDHQVGDRAHALLEHFVSELEGFLEGGFRLGDQEQILVRDDDQRVDMGLQLFDARFGRTHAAGAFEQERLGDDAHGQHAHAARGFGDDGRGAGAGAPAHARRDEAHVDAFERLFDLGDGFFGRCLANFRTRARAKAAGDVGPELDALFRRRGAERLRVGVGDDELDALDLGRDHVGDRVAAGPTDADDGDARAQIVGRCGSDIDAHQLVLRAQGQDFFTFPRAFIVCDINIVHIL